MGLLVGLVVLKTRTAFAFVVEQSLIMSFSLVINNIYLLATHSVAIRLHSLKHSATLLQSEMKSTKALLHLSIQLFSKLASLKSSQIFSLTSVHLQIRRRISSKVFRWISFSCLAEENNDKCKNLQNHSREWQRIIDEHQ